MKKIATAFYEYVFLEYMHFTTPISATRTHTHAIYKIT